VNDFASAWEGTIATFDNDACRIVTAEQMQLQAPPRDLSSCIPIEPNSEDWDLFCDGDTCEEAAYHDSGLMHEEGAGPDPSSDDHGAGIVAPVARYCSPAAAPPGYPRRDFALSAAYYPAGAQQGASGAAAPPPPRPARAADGGAGQDGFYGGAEAAEACADAYAAEMARQLLQLEPHAAGQAAGDGWSALWS
jgi:hypothetical protein